ncbi:hypothetical+protein [Methylocapsa aurea]
MSADATAAPSRNRALEHPENAFRRALAFAGGGLLIFTLSLDALDPPMPIASFFFHGEDFVFLVGMGLFLLALAVARLPIRFSPPPWTMRRPFLIGFGAAGAALAIAAIGAVYCFRQFDLVRDELDANFDATIFLSGHLLAPLAAEWRPFVEAFRGPTFVLPVPADVAWATPYLPGNAALRALMSTLVGPQWTNPILLGVAIAATFGVANRLWSGRPDAAIVAVMLLATSAQALVNAMTSYAMTGHLALNMLWLWLFLRGGRVSHGFAALAGFIACGLHQLVFHPLFVAPFILSLLFERRFRLFVYYVGAYAGICAFWTEYYALAQWIEGVPAVAASAVGSGFLIERVGKLLADANIGAVFLMMGNLARFLAWQNPVALPLVALGLGAVWRGDKAARPLAGGMVLATLAFGVLMPQQGNGWGYRYLHGFLGSWCLLAGYGWLAAMEHCEVAQRRAAGAAVAIAIAVSFFLLVPLRVEQVVASEQPYRAATETIARADADVVLVDRTHLMHGGGLVRNDPYLRNRPLTLDLLFVDDNLFPVLCAAHKVAVLTEERALALGVPYFSTAKKWDELREQKLGALRRSCWREVG